MAPLDASYTAPDTQTCADLAASARSQLQTTIAANRSCAADSDCVNADVGCFTVGSMPNPSNVAGKDTVAATTSELCAQLYSVNCEPVGPGMPTPNVTLYCGNGMCTSTL